MMTGGGSAASTASGGAASAYDGDVWRFLRPAVDGIGWTAAGAHGALRGAVCASCGGGGIVQARRRRHCVGVPGLFMMCGGGVFMCDGVQRIYRRNFAGVAV